jgi:hypothetical protein
MGKSGRTIRDAFFWTHSRGTIPYDILCGLILAFVFFVPRSCFAPKPKLSPDPGEQKLSRNSLPQQRALHKTSPPQQGK